MIEEVEAGHVATVGILRGGAALLRLLQELTAKEIETLRVARLGSLLQMGGASVPRALLASATRLLLKRRHGDGAWADTVESLWCAAFFRAAGERALFEEAVACVARDVHPSGAWGRSSRDMTRIPVTGQVAWLFPDLVSPSGKDWLLEEWRREVGGDGAGICANYKAAFALFTLGPMHPATTEVRNWLIHQAEPDGGWGPWRGHPVGSQALYTAQAVLALRACCDHCQDPRLRAAVLAGGRLLARTQLGIGLWPCHHLDEGSAWAWLALKAASEADTWRGASTSSGT